MNSEAQTVARRQSFADAFDPRNNAFGFLRLVLAVLVIFCHSYPLGNFGTDPVEVLTDGQHTIGLVAVSMFFALSGFLICRSACGKSTVPRFLWHRFLRIFPGYWGCLIFCALVFAPLVALEERGNALEIFSASQGSPQQYVLSNASLVHFTGTSFESFLRVSPEPIAGLLGRNPYPYMVNGSLWTLPFELGCYFGVALLAAIGVLRGARSLVLALFVVLAGVYMLQALNPQAFSIVFPLRPVGAMVLLALFFTAGCVCFLYSDAIPYSPLLFGVAVTVSVLTLTFGGFTIVAPVALPYALLWLAFRVPCGVFDRYGDISYGTYIYAFPVQQGLAVLGLHHEGFTIYFTSTVLLTALLAMLSYRLIEAPCLRLKNHQPVLFRRSRHSSGAEAHPRAVTITGDVLAG